MGNVVTVRYCIMGRIGKLARREAPITRNERKNILYNQL